MLKHHKTVLAIVVGIVSAQLSFSALAGDEKRIAEGKDLAFERSKGNCLACHMIPDGSLPGNIAPPLLAMKARFPDYDRLVRQISDPLASNPNSVMPPFGLHNILTEDEINKIAEYLYTL